MERKDIMQASISAALGAIGGTGASVIWGTEPIWWFINGLVSAFLGFVLYKPVEVIRAIRNEVLDYVENARSGLKEWKTRGLKIDWSFLLEIIKGVVAVVCKIVYLLVTLFWVPFLMGLSLATLMDINHMIGPDRTGRTVIIFPGVFFLVGVFCLFITAEADEKLEKRKSTYFPLVRLTNYLLNKIPEDAVEVFYGKSERVFELRNVRDLLIFSFLIPVTACVILPVVLISDILASLFIALATTWRLAAMTGAVAGGLTGAAMVASEKTNIASFTLAASVAVVIPPAIKLLRAISEPIPIFDRMVNG